VFPTWRDVWVSLDGVPELLAAADAALRRRMTGNQRLLGVSISCDGGILTQAIRDSRSWAENGPAHDSAARPVIAGRIYSVLDPLLRAVAWPRWLFLERAFLDASATGDLLFAALVLRTMCEEVLRLHALDVDADRLVLLAGSSVRADQRRLALFFSAAWTSLADLSRETVLDRKDWPSLRPMGRLTPRLEKARRTLNSYVHPNYCSHIAALFPEGASAALVLLEAVAAVYEAFFALSWAEERVTDPTFPTGIGALESWRRSVRRLREQTLPEIRRTSGNPTLAEAMKVPALIKWLTAKRDDLATTLRTPAAAHLVKDLPQRGTSLKQGELEYRMWEGASAFDVLDLALARKAERCLAADFPSGAPDPNDQIRWLRFNALSLQLAILLDNVKTAAFKKQLIRQITEGNSLGILLCVRSLIEHRALAVWLPREVGVSLNILASEVRAADPLPQSAAEVEVPLKKFLSAQAKESREQKRCWVLDRSGGVLSARLEPDKIVDAAFPEDDRLRTFYALSSAVMHGRLGRGGQLMMDASNEVMHARRIGLLVLERLCDRNEEMDHYSAAVAQTVRLLHAAAFGGTSIAATDAIAQKAFGLTKGQLVQSVDYSGEGTADSPFRLSPHIEFYTGSHSLLGQFGVDVGTCPHMIDRDTTGNLCDRWQAPHRDYWFRCPFQF
jgi:hypothetical protein